MGILLTAVVITLNEEKNIGRCIEALKTVADEILVVDSFSTDRTQKICNSLGVRFVQQEWLGFAQTKNTANQLATHDWILSIDADEVLSAELAESIRKVKLKPEFSAYLLVRIPNYAGKWIYHTDWNPDRHIRLFDRRIAHWKGEFIHEHLEFQVGTKVGKLKGWCLHYTIPTLEAHMNTINRYSELQAKEGLAKRRKVGLYHLLIKPPASFFISYFIRQGFRDGRHGLILSIMNAHAQFMKQAKTWMIQQKEDNKPPRKFS